jgi:PTH1 family peptidyl-tRNA hydrolase
MPQIVITLGRYAANRHNIGFMAVDEIARVHGFAAERAAFQGLTQEGALMCPSGRIKALILKPTTYMNESGRSVGAAARYFKIDPSDVVVFHDELDLAQGKVRVKSGGGLAGHNGLKSIKAHIGPEFRRVRIGIGHPGDKGRVSGHVLSDFKKADGEWVLPLLEAIADAAPDLAEGKDNNFMNKVAIATRAEEEPKKPNKAPKDQGPEDGI